MTSLAWTRLEDASGVVTLQLDVPGQSANTLSIAVLEELGTHLSALERAPPRGVLIRSGKSSGFIFGADVNEFAQLQSEQQALVMIRRGQSLFNRLQALPCPTVAMLQGYVLGGGLELALACRYRVAVNDGRLALGFPEVQLGIFPAFGGSVRAVRLLGVRAAMDMMLTARHLRADKALSLGLIDRLVAAEQIAAAALQLIATPPPVQRPPLLDRLLCLPFIRPLIGRQLRKSLRARIRADHYPAPFALVDVWVANGAQGTKVFDDEAHAVGALFNTLTARNLVRVFQLQDRLKSLGAGSTVAAGPKPQSVHVIGAGVMGGDIAAWCALRGLQVTLQDRTAELVEVALARAVPLFAKRIRDAGERAAAQARLKADVSGTALASADVVIEAIYENLDAKRELFARIETQLKPGALLATNTSSLTLESIATALQAPQRLVGLHFFNPVAQMPLVEVVHNVQTDTGALDAALRFARQLDRLPLPCRSSPGFLVNRALAPYLLEAFIALEQGIAPEVIDAAATDFGMPMGPIELADVVGLDVCRKVGQIVPQTSGLQPPLPLTRLDALIAAGHLGRKSGQGFYVWRDGKPQRGVAGRAPVDLQDRLILALVNEARACLREGLVADADLVDAGLIFGAGFAPFRGGPLCWAVQTGEAGIVGRLQTLAASHGQRFIPDTGWQSAST
jgi:3-hydroxyacyl-CoA dehydrogenase/enoyl-CoA hydratase/3-hydroxybutyryl-CoA epimerase